jgi:glycosidase
MSNVKLFSIFIFMFGIFSSCKDSKKTNEETVSTTAVDSSGTATKWWAGSNVYEVNLRQYSKAGTIGEFAKNLPRLKEMGVEILWFMPITPIGIEGRKENEQQMGSYYAVRNYTAFNEDYGTLDDWKAFVKQAQGMGFKVITDWVANHSAPDNHWVKEHPEFYAKDSTGKMYGPFDWTDVRKLDYSSRVLRDSMIAAMQFWLSQTGIDGFRCDVAAEVPMDFWKECIATLKAGKPGIFMLAEADKPELHAAGFDVTYGWQAMHAMKELYTGKYKLGQFDSVMNQGIKDFPENAARLFFTTNHDENSWNGTEYEKFGNAAKAFAVLTQTFDQSIPLIYSGQELPNKKRLKFFVKDTIPWNGKYEMASFYKTLLSLRKSNPALNYDAGYKRLASTRNDAVYAYVREKEGRKVVVVMNLSKQGQKFKVTDPVINGEPMNIFMGVNEKISDQHEFSIEPWGYIVYDYR